MSSQRSDRREFSYSVPQSNRLFLLPPTLSAVGMTASLTTCLTSLEFLPTFNSSMPVEGLSTLFILTNLWMLEILLKIFPTTLRACTCTATSRTLLKSRSRFMSMTYEPTTTYRTGLLFLKTILLNLFRPYYMSKGISLRAFRVAMPTSLKLTRGLSLAHDQRLSTGQLSAQSLASL